MADRDLVAAALDRIELAEARLLTWGIVDAVLTDEEFEACIAAVSSGPGEQAELRDALLEQVLVVEVPTGGYRSRMAETLRMLARLRQTMRADRWQQGIPLVLDYRFVHRARTRPARNLVGADVVDEVAASLRPPGRAAASAMAPPKVSAFQRRATARILTALEHPQDAATMVTAGTGSGKTLAAYLPAMAWITDAIAEDPSSAVRMLAIYPRNELLKDQFRAALTLSTASRGAGERPIRIGTWFGATPRAAFWVEKGWATGWRLRPGGDGWVCPFLVCPDCDGPMVWRRVDVQSGRERLLCPACGRTVDETQVTLTRERAATEPPDIMFTTTESVNRQLATPADLRAFGVGPKPARLVLLDEVHTYEGVSGAQNALLLRRLRRRLGAPIHWVGLSATLEDATDFLAAFVDVPGDRVELVEPLPDELEATGAEYLVALRHDPGSMRGPLSTSIQASMALARALDAPGTPFEPAPSSEGVFGRRAFVFTDKLDVTNRLYWDLLDAEGWWQPGRPRSNRPLTLAHLRAESQLRRGADRQEGAAERDAPGQWWWLAERLGRDLAGDEQLTIGRTSSQDAGVSADADVVVATATLEVGYDDDTVGAVIQHKAPHDPARFLQRKGRAGRDPSMRPWTVVVLSDWGLDRLSWELYDQLFDPTLVARHLPLRNRYVVRMQAVYSTLDWLGWRLAGAGGDQSAWADLSAPAETLESSDGRRRTRSRRQEQAAALLREVLDGGPAQGHLRAHLQRSLGLDDAELDAILWGPPRPLLLAVLPTALRRLLSQWAAESVVASQSARHRIPLPEFIAGNLFDDLLVPEVAVDVPTGADDGGTSSEALPAVRSLRELMPGNVTRHFGVSTYSRRHWVPIDLAEPRVEVDVGVVYGAVPLGTTTAIRSDEAVELFRPTAVRLEIPPQEVRDATSVRPRWDFNLEPLGTGRAVPVASGRWSRLIESLVVHTHGLGDGVRVQRFAIGAGGASFRGGDPAPVEVGFTADGVQRRVALGVELEVDALVLRIRATALGVPSARERRARLDELVTSSSALPVELSSFERESLAAAVRVALASGSTLSAGDADDAGAIVSALELLGSLNAIDPRVEGDGEIDSAASSDRRGSRLDRWARDAGVLRELRRVVEVVAGDRDPSWARWARHRLAATVASTFVEAASLASHEVSAGDLTVDLVDASEEHVLAWISELAPGGNGQIERLHHVLAAEPHRFARLLDRSVRPTDLETLDEDLVSFLDAASEDVVLEEGCEAVVAAWPHGHAAVDAAFSHLRGLAARGGLRLDRTAWTTVVNRLLAPGTSPTLRPTVRRLRARWEELEEGTGIALDAREFGAWCAVDTGVDIAFHLIGPTDAERSRAVGSYFWPRGASVDQPGGEVDAFGLLPGTDRSTLRGALGPNVDVIVISDWDDEVRAEVHRALVGGDVVELAFSMGAERLARRVVLDLQEIPVETGALLVHPAVVGVAVDGAQGTIVSASLGEAL